MRAPIRLLTRTSLALLMLLMATSVGAQATRTWVWGVGDDANPCSRTAPCKTFAGAISMTATGGIINAIDGGGFGAVTITKAITIDGSGEHASILASGVNGVIINIAAGVADRRVVLRDLSIDGAGLGGGDLSAPNISGRSGIRILAADSVLVENVDVQDFLDHGIEVAATSDINVTVRNVSINRIAGPGISVTATAGLAVADVDSVAISQSDSGIVASARSRVRARNTTVHHAGIAGFSATPNTPGTSAEVVLESSAATQGNAGVVAVGEGARVTLSDTAITGNVGGVVVSDGGSIASFGDNRIFDNADNGQPTEELGSQ